MHIFYPKILTTLSNYSGKQFRDDLVAGIIVGIVAVPLAIAFAIASGVSPDRGLITAVVAGFLISALGGSRVQIGGPTGAFVVIVYAIIQKHGLVGLQVATLMAGVILIGLGIAKLGGMVKMMPYPLTVGFTSGIAVLIFSSQVKDFLGLEMGNVPPGFLEKWAAFAHHFHAINFAASGLALLSSFCVIFFRRLSKAIPGTLIAIILCTLMTKFFHLPVETIGSRFGEIPNHLPPLEVPHMNLGMIQDLIPSAMVIAILAAVESLLSAVITDGMIGGRHRSNTELVAQGIANIVTPLFGGIPATGAIARTTTNIQNGGRTPVAGIIHALTLLLIMLCFGKWVSEIPLACLAGILVVVAYHMSEWRSFRAMLRSPRSDVMVLVTTFALTLLADLTVAIEVGMVLSAFLFMHRMATISQVDKISRDLLEENNGEDLSTPIAAVVPHGVEVYQINGSLFFGAAYKFMEAMRQVSSNPKVRIIRMRNVLTMDATGLQAIREGFKQSQKSRVAFLIEGIHAQPLMAFERAGLVDLIGRDQFFGSFEESLDRAKQIIAEAQLHKKK